MGSSSYEYTRPQAGTKSQEHVPFRTVSSTQMLSSPLWIRLYAPRGKFLAIGDTLNTKPAAVPVGRRIGTWERV